MRTKINTYKGEFAKTHPLLVMKLTKVENAVYTLMCMRAGSTGQFFQSYSSIGDYLSVDRSNVSRAVKALIRLGLIERAGETLGGINIFNVFIDGVVTSDNTQITTGVVSGDNGVLSVETTGVVIPATKNSQNTNNEGVSRDLKETIKETIKDSIVDFDKSTSLSDSSDNMRKDGLKESPSHIVETESKQTPETLKGEVVDKDANQTSKSFNIDVDEIYQAYPTKCPVTGKSTAKGGKNKRQIEKLLKTHSKGELLNIIALYVVEVKQEGFKQMKNFQTFLNNLPDYTEQLAELETESTPHEVESMSVVERVISANEFKEGESITAEKLSKLKKLYNDNDTLAVWAVKVGDRSNFETSEDMGESGVYRWKVSMIDKNVSNGWHVVKFIGEVMIKGQLNKEFNIETAKPTKYDWRKDEVEALKNEIEEKFTCRLHLDNMNVLRWLVYSEELSNDQLFDLIETFSFKYPALRVLSPSTIMEVINHYVEIQEDPNKLDKMKQDYEEIQQRNRELTEQRESEAEAKRLEEMLRAGARKKAESISPVKVERMQGESFQDYLKRRKAVREHQASESSLHH